MTFASYTFAAAVVLASITTVLCSTPPNANPGNTWKKDRLGAYATPWAARLRRGRAFVLGIYHALLALGVVQSTFICPWPQNVNGTLVEWNAYTSLCLILIICVGGPLRLAAFGRLGESFGFQLAAPGKLVTTGVYHYVQHPGYTGQMIVVIANLALFVRWDAAPGCFLPSRLVSHLDGWGFATCCVVASGMLRKLLVRVSDEEEMLRETFGKEWEEWHHTTMRFLPGIY